MIIHFSKERISARPDAGYYSPEKLTLLKRIFENACKKRQASLNSATVTLLQTGCSWKAKLSEMRPH